MRNRSGSGPSSGAALLLKVALFRYELRRFLRFSERAARTLGVTPQQHQLLLGVAGFTGRGTATISELAEFLQERHNAVVGLVERAAKKGLVWKKRDAQDRRAIQVNLTASGAAVLKKLTRLHLGELRRMRTNLTEGFVQPAQAARQT
ncbi:MAG TPA: MarR family transcriptional regulator [Terriglobia bacterium]|nr:MarR family transcriptional regulator [Terriglobia bacterium]